MVFNSLDFGIFLPTVFMLYWFVANKSVRHRNLLLLTASYVFYGWWNWKFLFLVLFSTLVDFIIGNKLAQTESQIKKKILLWISIVVNFGLLGFFKYYNFFIENFVDVFSFLGKEISISSLEMILPVGISFYTFQTLSYSIDIYKGKLEPTQDIIAFAAFVSFFPQLVAGPIERANNLLPQFYLKHSFDIKKAVDGLRQILWGLFKKIVVADNCAKYADIIFNNSSEYKGSTLLLGAFFFAFQIYGDFSGYSDIAIGTSRLFGFNLMQNFNFPYFSRDIAEFWKRWHISLSTWFRDYLYIPLGGSRGGKWMQIRNVFIIFIVSGFWHGANWTFIIWGVINAVYFLPIMLLKLNKNNPGPIAHGQVFPSLKELFSIAITFGLTTIAWIFFRAETLNHAVSIVEEIFSTTLLSIPEVRPATIIILLVLFILIEWIGRDQQYAIENLGKDWKRPVRYAFYNAIIIIILWFGGQEQQFIYFQF